MNEGQIQDLERGRLWRARGALAYNGARGGATAGCPCVAPMNDEAEGFLYTFMQNRSQKLRI